MRLDRRQGRGGVLFEPGIDAARHLRRESVVIARDGTRISIPFDTLCLHADMAGAVERLQAIRNALAE
jgi:lactam utilization protein B